MSATTVHLVRHASHGLLPHTLAGRMPGVPIDAPGLAQAAALAWHFRTRPVDAVLSSPVQRAQETARPIADALRLDLHTEPGFAEIDFGDWTGERFDALNADPRWAAWNRLRSMAACPGGESMHQAQSRALTAMARLHRQHAGQALVVVSHADLIKAILAPALGLSLDHLHRLTIDPASISTLVLFDHDLRIDGINRPA